MTNKDFSIIMPMYNSEMYIRDTLASIDSQTLDPSTYEVILCDDNSADDSARIVEEWVKGSRIESLFMKQDTNKGACAARNRAIGEATGRTIVNLDSDDLFTENALERFRDYGKPTDWTFAYTDFLRIFEDGQKPLLQKARPFTKSKLMHYNITGPGVKFFPKTVWSEIGGFDESLPSGQDWDFALRVSELGGDDQFLAINENLWTYRVVSSGITGALSSKNKFETNCAFLSAALTRRGIPYSNITCERNHPENSYYYAWDSE